MKKIRIIVTLLMFLLAGCGKNNVEPDLNQIRNISELATVKAYYHNVAKIDKKAGKGILHIGEIDRKYWIEYTGVAKIGIKMSDISMKVDGKNVIVKMPKAEILSHDYEDYNEDSIYKNTDSWNPNKITNDEINEAIRLADEEMLSKINENGNLFNRAMAGAEKLIRNYINEIGKLSNKTYTIKFEYM